MQSLLREGTLQFYGHLPPYLALVFTAQTAGTDGCDHFSTKI